MKRLLIAGGGTGGHVFCGLAVAEEWQRRGGEVLFVGTQKGMEFRLVPTNGYLLETISVSALKGVGLINKIRSLFKIPAAIWQSIQIIRKFGPTVVLGIGGYASGPTLLSAWLMRIPTAVVDQNSVPGMTNRYLGKIVRRVFLTFNDAAVFFNKQKIRLYGNPVIAARREGINRQPESHTLLICGGSQGAKAINELMLQVIPMIANQIPGLKVIHQTGVADFEFVKTEYEKLNVAVEVAPFFDSMDKVYKKASLLISRSGAGTLTEIALWGIPAIFIPFPKAADDHQRKNALHFVRKEAAMMLLQERTTPELLAQKIVELMMTPGVLKDMSEKTLLLGRPDAAHLVVSELLALN